MKLYRSTVMGNKFPQAIISTYRTRLHPLLAVANSELANPQENMTSTSCHANTSFTVLDDAPSYSNIEAPEVIGRAFTELNESLADALQCADDELSWSWSDPERWLREDSRMLSSTIDRLSEELKDKRLLEADFYGAVTYQVPVHDYLTRIRPYFEGLPRDS